MGKIRNSYYDFLKGLAIMGVVAIHTIIFNFEPYSLTGVVWLFSETCLAVVYPFL